MNKILRKFSMLLLLIVLIFPATKAFASQDEFIDGDGWYEDGMYLNPISTYTNTEGMQKNPYFEDKREVVSKDEADKIIKEENLESLIEAYNTLYKKVIKLYKYGYNHIDIWKKVDNMQDPVFGKVNKKIWITIYEKSVDTLQKTRYYFYSLGLTDDMYTYDETKSMADMEEVKFPEIHFSPIE